MSRLLLKPILVMTLTFTAFSLAARALGSAQPPNPALAGFTVGCEGKPQPCWHGIVPGVTTLFDTKLILENNGYDYGPYSSSNTGVSGITARLRPNRTCKAWFIYDGNDVLMNFSIQYCSGLRFGELMSFLGTPQLTHDCSFVDQNNVGNRPLQIVYENLLTINPYQEIAHNDVPGLSPGWIVSQITSNMPRKYSKPLQPWSGFVLSWRFRQLEEAASNCL